MSRWPVPAEVATGPVVLVRRSEQQHPIRALLLHGLGTSWRVWTRHGDPVLGRWGGLANPLGCISGAAADPEVWVGDLPWSGTEDGAWARHPDPTQWIARSVAAVPGGVDVVIAHSFAATMLLDLATRPIREQVLGGVKGLVLVSPFYKSAHDDFDWNVLSSYVNGFVHIMAEGIRVSAKGRPISGDLLMGMAERVQDRIGPYGWLKFFETYLRTPDMNVREMDIPCLILSGRGDVAAPPADSTVLAGQLPDAELTLLEHCGHFPMVETPAEFSAAIDRFNDRIQLTHGARA
ncbi:alpha/beta fold hydrolase [Nocardia sp. NPDC127579]|uniref:alpha/beta fold hydrolase n=1 Tax=Nocardia sp. NPDC127579 TaxID=3345402 RepID=UPI00363C1D3F